jgi:coenzyme F420-reducing hydrogenase delta subunit
MDRTSEEFEPTIVAFVCNWCTYTAADLAGTARMIQSPNVRLIRMMCTGMVDPKYVIKALLSGADGVLVSGCHPGDCHYINGNNSPAKDEALKGDLPRIRHRRAALQLTWVGPARETSFAAPSTNDGAIRSLGPTIAGTTMSLTATFRRTACYHGEE